jgi:hypothetical protein
MSMKAGSRRPHASSIPLALPAETRPSSPKISAVVTRGVVRRPVHQHVHAALREKQGEQGGQVGDAARAVVRRQDDGRPAAANGDAALVGGGEKADQLRDRLALDAHRQREGADFKIGDAAVEDLRHQVVCIVAAQRTCAFAATADHPEVAGNAHRWLSPRRRSPCAGRRVGPRELMRAGG